tara:strand:+ start:5839 stop:6075 length:237 start_codon:yes stop_codon:yes gene_type:complete
LAPEVSEYRPFKLAGLQAGLTALANRKLMRMSLPKERQQTDFRQWWRWGSYFAMSDRRLKSYQRWHHPTIAGHSDIIS